MEERADDRQALQLQGTLQSVLSRPGGSGGKKRPTSAIVEGILRYNRSQEVRRKLMQKRKTRNISYLPDGPSLAQSDFHRVQKGITEGDFHALRDELCFHGTRVNKQNGRGETHLHIVCREGYFRGLKFLLDPNNFIRVRATRSDGSSTVSRPVNPDVRNHDGRPPIALVFTPPHLYR